MAYPSVNASGLPRTWLPAVLVSSVVSALCAAALYVLLVQQDRALVAQRNAAAAEAVEGNARAMARAFAWFSESLLGEHLANVQQALEGQALPIDLLDAALIAEDNLIVAARNPAVIGRQFQEPGWTALRNSQAGSVTPALERGRQVLVAVEPVRQQNRVIGWVRLVFAAPQDVATTRSTKELMREVAIAILPLFILTATLVLLSLRVIMSRVRSLIGRILLDAMGDSPDRLEKTVPLSKAG